MGMMECNFELYHKQLALNIAQYLSSNVIICLANWILQGMIPISSDTVSWEFWI